MHNDKKVVIIPTYNELENINAIITKVLGLLGDFNILIIDDGSPDGTAVEIKRMQSLQENEGRIHLIERSGKLGLGTAYLTGFKWAIANDFDYIFEMDADFSHDPADIPRLLAAMDHFDVVIGSRRVPGGKIIGWNWYRHTTSFVAMTLAKLILGLKTKDVTAGFRAYRRKVLEVVLQTEISSNGYAFQEAILFRCEKNACLITEIPVTFLDRKIGKSKLTKTDIWEFFRVMKRLRKEKNNPDASGLFN